MKSLFAFLILISISHLSFSQWKINETFDSEIPTEWTGVLGNPGWSYTTTTGSQTGIAKGQTGSTSNTYELISPKVELTIGDSLFFNHYAICSSADQCTFHYKINNGSWTNFHQTDVAGWQNQSFALQDLVTINSNDSIQFKLSVGGETFIYLYVDYFRFGQSLPSEIPECTNLIAPTNAETEVSLFTVFQWNAVENATEYKLCLGTDNNPTNIMDSISIGSDTIYIIQEALNPNTEYFWEIIAVNALGETSGCGISSFTTKTDFYPYEIDFEHPQNELPGGWIVLNGTPAIGLNEWHPAYNSNGNGHDNSNGFLSISFNVSNPKDSYFISPSLPMNADNLYRISFYYNASAKGCYEKLEVKSGSSNSIAGQTTQIWNNPVINRNGFVQAVCYIQPETTADFYISWHAYSDENEFALILDDITIEELPNGPAATTQAFPVIYPATQIGENSEYILTIRNQGSGSLESTNIIYPDWFSGPESFSTNDTYNLPVSFAPEAALAGHDTLIIETNGGVLHIPIEFTGGKKTFDCNEILTMYNNFIVIDNNNDNLNWEMNDYRTHEGPYSFQLTDDFTSENYDDFLITPELYILEGDQFSFWARTIEEISFFATWEILISTNAGTEIADFTEILAPTYYLPGEWTAYNYDLSTYAGQTIRIAVHSNSTSYWTSNHYMDNIGLPYTENPMECNLLLQPTDGQEALNPNEVLLEWEMSPLADGYILSVGTDYPPTNLISENIGNQTSFTLIDIEENTEFYWTVQAAYGNIQAESCVIQSFTTGEATTITQDNKSDFSIVNESGNYYLLNPNGELIENIEIINIEGITSLKHQKNTNDTRIILNIKAQGIHFIRFDSNNKTHTIKFSHI